jgi:single-strand DNA-binding protein
MSSYNRVILMGNLTKDPEVKTLGSGSSVANISLAVNRKYTANNGEKREEVTYVDVNFWGKQAELFTRLEIRKGTPLFVEGRLHLESWEDKSTGQKRSRLKVVGENFQLLGGRKPDAAKSGTVVKKDYDQSRPKSEEPDGYGYSDEPF